MLTTVIQLLNLLTMRLQMLDVECWIGKFGLRNADYELNKLQAEVTKFLIPNSQIVNRNLTI